MKFIVAFLVLLVLENVVSDCVTSPPSDDYIVDARVMTDFKNSLQVWVSDGSSQERCVEMKTNVRKRIYELECCSVCFQLTEWMTGFEDQYVKNLEIVEVNEGSLNGMEVVGQYMNAEGAVLSFTYFLNHVFANPEIFYYFSVPFAEGSGRDDETEVIYIFTTQTSTDPAINRIITLHYGNGVDNALTSMEVNDFNAMVPGSWGHEVFRDWDYSSNGHMLGYFADFGFSVPVKNNHNTDSCLGNATVAFEIDESKVMTSLTLLDYDMKIAPPFGRHNARGVHFTPMGTSVRVFFPYQEPMEFFYDANRVRELQEQETRCDHFNVPANDQC